MKEWKKAKSTCSKIIETNNDVVKVEDIFIMFSTYDFEILNHHFSELALLIICIYIYLAHVIEQQNFRFPNPQYLQQNFVYLIFCLIKSRTNSQQCLKKKYIYIEIMQPFLILSKSQRSLKMCSQNH